MRYKNSGLYILLKEMNTKKVVHIQFVLYVQQNVTCKKGK